MTQHTKLRFRTTEKIKRIWYTAQVRNGEKYLQRCAVRISDPWALNRIWGHLKSAIHNLIENVAAQGRNDTPLGILLKITCFQKSFDGNVLDPAGVKPVTFG